ncbi:hypothetical protein SOVF_104310 [Spinacia oleracea]|nr:hypothetical protein SOVF_104310 [Spinacia oleracea]
MFPGCKVNFTKWTFAASSLRCWIRQLPPAYAKIKGINGMYTENELRAALEDTYSDLTHEIDFESFLRVHDI